MSAPTNHWKLGLFVVIASLLGCAAVLYLGTRSMPKQTVTYSSFFDEAVTGLESSSPVKFRGVTIGNVSRIELGPDRRHVKVSYELTVSVLDQMGIARGSGEKARMPVAPNLRAQLNTTGVTGIKYVQLDFFDDANQQPPALPFPVVDDHYIPAQPSALKNIESSVLSTADRLPEIMDRLNGILTRVQHLSEQIDDQNLPQRASMLIGHADHTLVTLDEKLAQLDTRAISHEAQPTLSSFQGTAARANGILDRVGGERGLMASAERVSDSLGDAARNANGFGSELEHTLRDVSEAAGAIKDLADALERQPDMLLKGRSRAQR
jgi:phospholipid/cholesterol/gamma-HCH transport system substrate-binding protein